MKTFSNPGGDPGLKYFETRASSHKESLFSNAASKEGCQELQQGIKKCTISLPLCMMMDAFEQLKGASPYENILQGWEQLCKDVPRSANFNKRLLFFNGKFLSAEKITAFSSDLIKIKKECRAAYFEKYIIPELHFMSSEQAKILFWTFSQNIFSNGMMLVTPCLRRLSNEKKHCEFGMTGATKTITNISFPKSGEVEVVTLTQGIHVKEFNSTGDLFLSDTILPRPEILVKFKSAADATDYLLPCKSVTTDSLALAHVFFKNFCSDQLNIYKEKVLLQKKISSICILFSDFLVDERSRKFESEKILLEVYRTLVEKPISAQQLTSILRLFSKCKVMKNSVDKFFLDFIQHMPQTIKWMNAVFASMHQNDVSRNQLNLRRYTPEKRKWIETIFSNFLKRQQFALPAKAYLKGKFLVLHNINTFELREQVYNNKIIYELLKNIIPKLSNTNSGFNTVIY